MLVSQEGLTAKLGIAVNKILFPWIYNKLFFKRHRALYNYIPQNDDEVELQEGDVVYVMEKCDDGWFVGTSQRSGTFGTFPGNYVAKI